MQNTEIFKELILLKENSLRSFSILKIFITTNNQELGSRFHSFAAKTSIDCLLCLCQVFHVSLILSYCQN